MYLKNMFRLPWSNDLILLSGSVEGLDISIIYMIVNETKTYVMCFSKCTEIKVKNHGVLVQQVNQYMYLGNILMPARK